MTPQPKYSPSEGHNRQGLGLPLLAIIGLAMLAAPRIILHDLSVIEEGTLVNGLFVYAPPIVWILVGSAVRVRRPFLTLLLVGVFYGVVLAGGHQLLWDEAFPAGTPTLGGQLSDLDPTIQNLVLRGFAALSSLVTGTLVGALCGLITAGITALLPSRPSNGTHPRS